MSKNLNKVTICKRCVSNTTIPGFEVNENDCNYCELHDKLNIQYPIEHSVLDNMIRQIKEAGKGKGHDCIIGVSGGCDSSYLLYKAVEWGLKPLAVHYDNGWNSEIAKSNMDKMISALNVPIDVYAMDPGEANDIWKSFLKAGVPDIEAPTDIALATVAYRAADKYNVKYILDGHSFRTEGVAPLGVSYMDGKYIADVHRKFGSQDFNTFPNLWLSSWMKWLFKGIKRVRPLYHIEYNKEEAKKFLNDKFDWEWYDHHHGENIFTSFFRNHFRNNICGIDSRITECSALIRSGQMERSDALKLLETPLEYSSDIEIVRNRLSMTTDEWDRAMRFPIRNHKDFKNYKATFKKLKFLFWIAYKKELVPKTFYIKYCK
jgi:tRNA(Ile)-lysidine synthase TilS/MesJ